MVKKKIPWWVGRNLPNPATLPEIRRINGDKHKGKTVWDKGLHGNDFLKHFKNGHPMKGKHHSDETRLKMSLSSKGRKKSALHRLNMSLGGKGKKCPWLAEYNRKYKSGQMLKDNPMKRDDVKERHARVMSSDSHRRKIKDAVKLFCNTSEYKLKMSVLMKERWKTDAYRKKMLISLNQPEYRHAVSVSVKKLWGDNSYRASQTSSILKSLIKRPTSLEQSFIELFIGNKINARYIGDGREIIEGKNPDFIIPDTKIIIDVRHTAVCKFRNKISFEEYKLKRIKYFEQYGWNCLVFSEKDLQTPDDVIMRINDAFRISPVCGSEFKNEDILLRQVSNFVGGFC